MTMAGCFKLNPEFVEGGATTGEVGTTGETTVGTTDATGDSSDTGQPVVSRVDEGLQVLYVFDAEACENPGLVVGRTESTPNLVLRSPTCASCEPDGLRIAPEQMNERESCVDAGIDSLSVMMEPGAGFTIELWFSASTEKNGVMLGWGEAEFVLYTEPDHVADFQVDPGTLSCPVELGSSAGSQHLAVTYAEGMLRLYANEREDATDNDCAITVEQLDEFFIGPMSPNRRWDGTIQLLAIYDRALSFNEYAQNDDAGPWPPRTP